MRSSEWWASLLVAWPLFLLGPAAMMAALFAFLVVLGALAGGSPAPEGR